MKFKSQYSLNERIKESSRVINKYPDRLPVICEKSTYSKNSNLLNVDKSKYLVPMDLTISQFLYVIRNRLKLSAEIAIFLFVGRTIPPSSALMSYIYNKYKDIDGFLYITYSSENVFGFTT